LEGSANQVQVRTDHKNLTYFTTTKELNRRQIRWAETLATYNFRISYVKGTENARADALSRKPEYLANKTHVSRAILKQEEDGLTFNHMELAATLVVTTDYWTPEFKQQYDKDTIAKHQLQKTQPPFTVENGILYFQGRTYVPAHLRKKFVEYEHSLPAHGHKGVRKTLERISRSYYFPGIRKMVTEVILNCDTCIRNTAARHAPYGHMKQPETPPRPWESIAMDFVTKLPLSKDPWTNQEYDSILVVTDRLTKYAYMLPYKEASTAEDLARVFLREIISQHGTPTEIISDRDKLFTSKFWTTLTALLGIKRKLSTAFHPQTDGQTERINQTMETYLRCYVNYKQDNWVELLPLAQFAYNSSESEGTGRTPFFANYGYTPEAYKPPLIDKAHAQQAMIKVDELTELHLELKTDIEFIAQRSAMYYNNKHSVEPELKEGEKVYLLRKNVQTKRPSNKLDHKKLGPFEIDKKFGPVTYKLKLPRTMEIHPVFHISLLEKAPPGAPPAPKTEVQQLDPQQEFEVEAILDCQTMRGVTKYLIKWKGYPHSENTWEPKSQLNCPDLLENYHQQNPKLPRKKDLPSPRQGRRQGAK
jgi:transposase InsO family protein